MEKHFERVEELIKDDDKIVTVTSYALLANITLEEAQNVVAKYAEVNKESQEIHLTYILCGTKKNSIGLSVVQVSDAKLNDELETYTEKPRVVVFSIQKAKNIDYTVLSEVESSVENKSNTLLGAVVGRKCIKRVLKSKVLPPPPAPTIKGKSSVFMQEKKSEEKVSIEAKVSDGNDENKTKKPSTQSNIATMFNKASQGKKGIKQEKPAKPANAFANFFTKVDKTQEESKDKEDMKVDPTKNEIVETKDKATNVSENKSDLFDSDTDDDILKDLSIPEKSIENKKTARKQTKAAPRKTAAQKKKRQASDVDNKTSVKKRRRIIVENSDSDDIFDSEKSDTDENTVKSDEELKTETFKPLAPKNKRRKAVKKTYEDAEGFIVTQTEYVYETASEDELEPSNKVFKKEEPKVKLEKKSSSNSENEPTPQTTNGKKKTVKKALSANQPTLMNFFTKK